MLTSSLERRQIRYVNNNQGGESEMSRTVLRAKNSVRNIRDALYVDPYQSALPWNYLVSLETQARSFLPVKLDPAFAQQTMLSQDTLATCRQRNTRPVIVAIEGDTDLLACVDDRDEKVRAYSKISQTDELSSFRKWNKHDTVALMITSDISQAATYSKAGVPFCFRREDKMPMEYMSELLLRYHFPSWLGVYIHLPTVIAWNQRTQVVPAQEGLTAHASPILTTLHLWNAIQTTISWYMKLFQSKQYGVMSALRPGVYSKYKYYVNCVYPGVTIATTPFWIECSEMLEYFTQFV